MAKILSVEREKGVEEQILLSLIVSTDFCNNINQVINYDYFQIADHQIIARWAMDYYTDYKQAVGKRITGLYHIYKKDFNEERAQIIYHVLNNIGYEFYDEETFNVDMMIKEASKYFKKRNLELAVEKMQAFLSKNAIDEAEQVRYEISPPIEVEERGIFTLSTEALEEIANKEKYNHEVFNYSGYFNNIIGNIERGQFLAFLGGPKTGKSWMLVETACQALIRGLKIIFVSLEMPRSQINDRIYQRMNSLIVPSIFLQDKVHHFPVLDCKKNQNDSCFEKYRTSEIGLINCYGKLCTFEEQPLNYVPCSYCYENAPDLFDMTTWFESIPRPELSYMTRKQAIDNFKYLKENLVTVFYPRTSMSIQEITQKIEILKYKQKFFPDVLIVDYLDITKGNKDRHDLNAIWEYFDSYTTDQNIIGVTVSQAGRQTKHKTTIDVDDVSEEWRKIAHVNKFIGIHQTIEEKRRKVLRLGLLANREDDFDKYHQALVLQNLSAGQVCLDSYKYIAKEEK